MSCFKSVKPVININRSSHLNLISRRMFSDECLEKTEARKNCTTPNLNRRPCIKAKVENDGPITPKQQYNFMDVTMWQVPECCCNKETGLVPLRHDMEYLKEQPWTERSYRRTWYQCPERVYKKVKCSDMNIKYAEPERRPRGAKNPDAKWTLKISDCIKVPKYGKPCEQCKKRVVCIDAKPSCCRKRCTQYPSFSECCQRSRKLQRNNECSCLYFDGLCAVNEYLQERGLLKKAAE